MALRRIIIIYKITPSPTDRESLRELARCRHAALDRILHLQTETYAGDPAQCSRVDDSPDDPGISNA